MKEYKFKINGNDYAVQINDIEEGTAEVTVNGAAYNVEIQGMEAKSKAPKLTQVASVASSETQATSVKTAAKPASGGGVPIKSPLPGVILSIAVNEGDTVKVGQRLLVLEAMKMENNIDADRAGVIKSIVAHKGDSVLEGDVLLTIE